MGRLIAVTILAVAGITSYGGDIDAAWEYYQSKDWTALYNCAGPHAYRGHYSAETQLWDCYLTVAQFAIDKKKAEENEHLVKQWLETVRPSLSAYDGVVQGLCNARWLSTAIDRCTDIQVEDAVESIMGDDMAAYGEVLSVKRDGHKIVATIKTGGRCLSFSMGNEYRTVAASWMKGDEVLLQGKLVRLTDGVIVAGKANPVPRDVIQVLERYSGQIGDVIEGLTKPRLLMFYEGKAKDAESRIAILRSKMADEHNYEQGKEKMTYRLKSMRDVAVKNKATKSTMSSAEIQKLLSGTEAQMSQSDLQLGVSLIQMALNDKWDAMNPKVGNSGIVSISCNINPNGGLTNVRITKSSGDQISDKAALVVARSVSSIQGLPEAFIARFKKETITIRYEVRSR